MMNSSTNVLSSLKLVFISFLLIQTICVPDVFGWRNFWKGRRDGGNLGEPVGRYDKSLQLAKDEWFEQILDHEDPWENRTWKQRYFTNDEFHVKNGPVFLMIGGEGEASAKWMKSGAWIEYAKEHQALCFQLEHRFYGKSHPTSDLSTENLYYLSSEQALADLSYFITAMNKQYNLDASTKWIAFGGSYPGSLAAWLREKYPHLVHGAVSSSGPLLAEADFVEYFEVVTESLGTYSDNCVDAVKQSIRQVEILLKHMVGNRNLNDKFKLCDPIEESVSNPSDVSNLFEALASNFAGVVQYNKDYRSPMAPTIDTICDIMVNQTIGPPVTRLAAVNELLLKEANQTCLDYKYDKMINEMKNISWTSKVASGNRQWTYQTCTEFGFYQTSNNQSLVFGDRFNVDFFIQQCADVYGKDFNSDLLSNGITRTNTNYGELRADTTNVIYVHGSIDPWHALGLYKESKNPNMPTIFIEGTAHCANMYEPQDDDMPQLKEARVKINNFIKGLLN